MDSKMNERIRELAEQAVLQANEVFDQKGKDYPGIVMEKFAELIVRECMELTKQCSTGSGIYDLFADEIIAEHFGVEE
jgi:hypothetical protein